MSDESSAEPSLSLDSFPSPPPSAPSAPSSPSVPSSPSAPSSPSSGVMTSSTTTLGLDTDVMIGSFSSDNPVSSTPSGTFISDK